MFRVEGSAILKIKELAQVSSQRGAAVRITVNLQAPVNAKYELEFVHLCDARANDVLLVVGGILFRIDNTSFGLLDGTTIEYVEAHARSTMSGCTADKRALNDYLRSLDAARLQDVILSLEAYEDEFSRCVPRMLQRRSD